MKRVFCVFIFTFMVLAAHAQEKHMSVGFMNGIAVDYETVTIGVDFRYNILSDVRIAPSITHMISRYDQSAWYFDCDAHYVVAMDDKFSFYPIGGISLSALNLLYKTHARLGFNVGLGGEIRIIDQLSVGLDMKYNVVQDYHQALVAVRAAYHF